ncbi:16S rRNA processing protein RimM [Dethiosulfatibacter aminovorans DSM 17477]|uniref:Ribosome maturation factor RimM n=1 Tax=Dethiosulfatibacter aminovorans DSM 17477 TaxID=1121476 RepID=A0A1M6DG42_9FIRM|nr:ribosome maturation factor RimM [Dethiosulfatibacter aminovorans]SHI72111.1 16S rRNA processing protein RimM [Dethiosulfatibacter aminovorans DSM 17477]
MEKIVRVGKIVNTHGLKGEVKCIYLTDEMERFDDFDHVYIEDTKERLDIESARYMKGMVYLRFKGFDNINLVEKYKNKYIIIDETQMKTLDEDSYYVSDLIGLEVYDMEGNYLGKITYVYQTGANDVYELNRNKELLIPAIKEVVKSVDISKGRMTIKKIEGLLS